MAKVRGPLFSLTARGRFGNNLYFQKRGNSTVAVTNRVSAQSSRQGRNEFKDAIAYGIRYWNWLCNFRVALGPGRQCIPLWLANRAPPDQDAYHFFSSLWLDFPGTGEEILRASGFPNADRIFFREEVFYAVFGNFPGELPVEPALIPYRNTVVMSLLLWLNETGYCAFRLTPQVGIFCDRYYNSSRCRFLGDGRGNAIYLLSDNYLVTPTTEEQIF